MSEQDCDVAILGGGPAGCALALLLARAAPEPGRIALLRTAPGTARAVGGSAGTPVSNTDGTNGVAPDSPRQNTSTSLSADADPRVLALNHGSRVLLQSLGAWPGGAADIRTIHVSQRGRLGRTLIRHDDFGVAQLGSVVRYGSLHAALERRLEDAGVRIVQGPPAQIEGAEEQSAGSAGNTQMDRSTDGVQDGSKAQAAGSAGGRPNDGDAYRDGHGLAVRSGETLLRCGVAVQADGAPPPDIRREYGQHAVLATVMAAQARDGWAWERFTREGPLALLPHPDGGGAHSVVWCCAPARAAQLAAAGDDVFSAELNAAFGERLGRLTARGGRHVFPLALVLRRRPAGRRTAAIGNAAQTLHPVAGQGLNLGLRDAARLALALTPWLEQPGGDPALALDRYAAARRSDRWLTAGLTDLLPRVFATGLAPVEHAAGLALLALDLAAPLRRPLARHLLQGLRA